MAYEQMMWNRDGLSTEQLAGMNIGDSDYEDNVCFWGMAEGCSRALPNVELH